MSVAEGLSRISEVTIDTYRLRFQVGPINQQTVRSEYTSELRICEAYIFLRKIFSFIQCTKGLRARPRLFRKYRKKRFTSYFVESNKTRLLGVAGGATSVDLLRAHVKERGSAHAPFGESGAVPPGGGQVRRFGGLTLLD